MLYIIFFFSFFFLGTGGILFNIPVGILLLSCRRYHHEKSGLSAEVELKKKSCDKLVPY